MTAQTGLGNSAGVPVFSTTTPSGTLQAAQLTTQVNPAPTIVTGQSNAMAEQVLAVIGPVYNSAGGILNKAQNNGSTVTTGGGP